MQHKDKQVVEKTLKEVNESNRSQQIVVDGIAILIMPNDDLERLISAWEKEKRNRIQNPPRPEPPIGRQFEWHKRGVC